MNRPTFMLSSRQVAKEMHYKSVDNINGHGRAADYHLSLLCSAPEIAGWAPDGVAAHVPGRALGYDRRRRRDGRGAERAARPGTVDAAVTHDGSSPGRDSSREDIECAGHGD